MSSAVHRLTDLYALEEHKFNSVNYKKKNVREMITNGLISTGHVDESITCQQVEQKWKI